MEKKEEKKNVYVLSKKGSTEKEANKCPRCGYPMEMRITPGWSGERKLVCSNPDCPNNPAKKSDFENISFFH